MTTLMLPLSLRVQSVTINTRHCSHKVVSLPPNLSMPLIQVILFIFFLSQVLAGCTAKTHIVTPPAKGRTINECVILFHGMGRTNQSMESMQEALISAGYHTVNVNYPSRDETIQMLSENYFPISIELCEQFNPSRIHFVTHSLGGIIVRMGIKEHRPHHLGRVVMLSPPNAGSPIIDTFRDNAFYSWIIGPAGKQLSTDEDSVPNTLGPADYAVGIITGNQHAFFDTWLADMIPGTDDGKVAIESALLAGMDDFLVVEESHPFIMNSAYVHYETISFLKNGFFDHRGEAWFKLSHE